MAKLVFSADDVEVHVSQLLTGVGLFAWGIVVALVGWWLVSDPVRARRNGEGRWRLARRRADRRGVSRDEWLENWARSQKSIAKWFGIPFLSLWFAVCLVLIVRGVHG